MGSSEMEKPTKDAKKVKESKIPTTQEQASPTSACTVPPDWSGFQAYSPIPPHGYMASTAQTHHPYMWGVQHLMPPYGTTPHPYVAMYPHGGIYAHPSIPLGSYPFSPFGMPSPNGVVEASGNAPVNMEVDGKPSEVKEKLPIKRSKGSLGSLNMITGKDNGASKSVGAVANGRYSKSGESASEGSTGEGSDANSENGSQMKSGSRQDSLEAETSQNGNAHGSQNGGHISHQLMVSQSLSVMSMSAAGAPGGVTAPTINLNIGTDYWGGATSSAIPAMHGKISSAPVAGGTINAGSRDSMQSQLWLQDERELKRQRRKQSNRESARRSRLRKQAECDVLAQSAESLKEENASLRAELNRVRSDYDQLVAQNASLKKRLGGVPEQEDPQSGRNDQHEDNETQLSGPTESLQSGH